MIRLDERLREGGFRARLLLQVHDELLLEAPEDEVDRLVPVLRETMEGALPLSVPLTVDVKVGRTWEGMTPVSRRDAVLAEADELPPEPLAGVAAGSWIVIEPTATQRRGMPGPLIRLDALTKRFRAVTALDGLTLSSSPGSSAWSGRTGPGRAPSSEILLGLIAPTSGDGGGPRLRRDAPRHDGPVARRLHARARCAAARPLRDGARRAHGGALGAAPRRRPASGPPRCSATSGCTRSAIGRSAATRPGCASG